jgi:transglutaminase-like putative cysteine protease
VNERLPVRFARGLPFLALALFGGAAWMQMLEPAQGRRAVWAAAIAIGALAATELAARRRGRARAAILAATILAGAVGALLAAGVPDELLRPDRWQDLLAGIGRGIGQMSGARVPYRGLDPWTATAIMLGATALTLAAGLLAGWPRRDGSTGFPIAALVLLVGLSAVPVISLADNAFGRGAVLAVLVLAFLLAERVRVSDAAGAGMAVIAVAVLALVAAPLLDGDDPWFDYETWALEGASSETTVFDWDHGYGVLDWPREGKEVLRVKARRSTYWKAQHLDLFNGERWQAQTIGSNARGAFEQIPYGAPGFSQAVLEARVTVRHMRSGTFVVPGTPLRSPEMPGRQAITTGVPGIYSASRELRRGDAFVVRAYVPTPRTRDLLNAGTEYPAWSDWYRVVGLPGLVDGRRFVRFPAFGDEGALRVWEGGVAEDQDPERIMRDSELRRTWELARRLREGSASPYRFLKRVEAYLARDAFSYSETPPESAQSLEGFLFDAREGYCQHFSGAMALLLRMGGVPARVATGFSPGSLDEDAGEFVVRDTDAHSWVEAWFEDIGWVPFDPTPNAAPPAAQAAGPQFPTAAVGDVADLGTSDAAADARRRAAEDGPPTLALVAAGLAAVGLVCGAVAWRRRRARMGHAPVDELERALLRAGWRMGPATTLRTLERAFASSPEAARYVRQVRESRYAAGGVPPTGAQRRALRRALRAGRGGVGHVRAWWAVPPRLRG